MKINSSPITIAPGNFSVEDHFYPRVLNAHLHPLVRHLMEMGNERIICRYCHLHPEADESTVRELLTTPPRYFRWGGSDLIHVTTEEGLRRVVIIETNSCPSGQKSMPRSAELEEEAGYQTVLERSFLPALRRRKKAPKGELAVLYDKNHMENTGYAATLATLADEPVHLVPLKDGAEESFARFNSERILEIRTESGDWIPIRAAFRYVTQKPWNRIPPLTRTLIYNPILVCLAGGRNKLMAAKAYDFYNARNLNAGLQIATPETIWDVSREEVPIWVERMGGVAVVKVPYSNAGQGVYTIVNDDELEAFMSLDHQYDKFIVQALIGNSRWSSQSRDGRLFHVGTMPDKKLNLYVADLRFMVATNENGYFPVAIYSRRARQPLESTLATGASSWDMLGTNLSIKQDDGSFATEPSRLLLVDSRDFNRLGLGMDDLIESYVQTVMSIAAIDQMSQELVNTKGRFRRKLFLSMNPDESLANEIMTQPSSTAKITI